jgi:hypothetical protein
VRLFLVFESTSLRDMDNRRVTLSFVLIVLICFFLPWIQLSCGKSEEDLAVLTSHATIIMHFG